MKAWELHSPSEDGFAIWDSGVESGKLGLALAVKAFEFRKVGFEFGMEELTSSVIGEGGTGFRRAHRCQGDAEDDGHERRRHLRERQHRGWHLLEQCRCAWRIGMQRWRDRIAIL
eukprot:3743077-Pleurochrysis_carterae.AAC.1